MGRPMIWSRSPVFIAITICCTRAIAPVAILRVEEARYDAIRDSSHPKLVEYSPTFRTLRASRIYWRPICMVEILRPMNTNTVQFSLHLLHTYTTSNAFVRKFVWRRGRRHGMRKDSALSCLYLVFQGEYRVLIRSSSGASAPFGRGPICVKGKPITKGGI